MTGNPFLTVGFTASPPHRAPPRPTRAQLCAQNPPRPSPSPSALLAVDEEFEAVSTQLLKRTQAMLNKYRLLLLEESRVRQGRRSASRSTWAPSSRAAWGHGELGLPLTKAGRAFLALQLGLGTKRCLSRREPGGRRPCALSSL